MIVLIQKFLSVSSMIWDGSGGVNKEGIYGKMEWEISCLRWWDMSVQQGQSHEISLSKLFQVCFLS